MTVLIEPYELDRFRAIIGRTLGLNVDDSRLAQLGESLRRRIAARGQSLAAYLDWLAELDYPHDEFRELSIDLTVNETYFFRHFDQFLAFREVAVPESLERKGASRSIRALSAGCASGEEPYTLAISLRELVSDAPGYRFEIDAVDLNPEVLSRAAAGLYSSWSLRETPEIIRSRWFRRYGREYELDASIRSMVRFYEGNLADEDSPFWGSMPYDVIFCRNLLMYLTPDHAQTLVNRLTALLVPHGFLFLGHAENLRGLSRNYHLCHTHGTFYYRRKGEEEPSPVLLARNDRGAAFGGRQALTDLDVTSAGSWVDAIQHASERIRLLTAARKPTARQSFENHSEAAASLWDLGHTIELLQRERFTEALDGIRRLPPESMQNPDVLLLHAVLLTHAGQLTDAERICRDMMALDEMNAGAHYLMALCREGVGDYAGAIEYDQTAIYCDPAFAMPHLHWGFMAKRAGDLQTAHHELSQAQLLLQREDSLRILFFGGGFGRDTLLALCESEISNCGEPT